MNLLSWNYWFNTRPAPFEGWTQIALLSLIVLMVALVIFSKTKQRQKKIVYKKLWIKLFNFGLAQTIIGLFLAFFNFQMVPILMSKFWYLLWLIVVAVWLFFLIRFALTLPKRKTELIQKKEFEKYLP